MRFFFNAVLFVFSLQLILASNPNYKQTAPPLKKMKLVWSDEFNYKGKPNEAFWCFEEGFVRNNELQWYQSDNAFCKKGVLVIEARRENKPNPNYDASSDDWRKSRKTIDYSSACIVTKNKVAFQYGTLVVRARIDVDKGSWPAIWTLGVQGEWPANGEIDLMEFYRINNQPHILANTAWADNKRFKAQWNSVKMPLQNFEAKNRNWGSKFHEWRMDWTADYIKMYLDGVHIHTTELNKVHNLLGDSTIHPFRQPHFFLLNLAVGSNGGDPSQTSFPLKYEVDYIRFYQPN